MCVEFILNGEKVKKDIPPGMRLIEMLRDVFGLTGTKESCGQGECGACTILFNSRAVHACMMLAAQVNGGEVVTIEGLAQGGELDAIQDAFLRAGAVQCGYCTPGMVMSAKALLLHNPHPTRQDIEQAMAGNICRCTGYRKIIEAVENAAAKVGDGCA